MQYLNPQEEEIWKVPEGQLEGDHCHSHKAAGPSQLPVQKRKQKGMYHFSNYYTWKIDLITTTTLRVRVERERERESGTGTQVSNNL